jgi:L-threonylcarbamoyladenylate synthase
METVKLDDVVRNSRARKKVVEAMITGKIFIYPTDTIYGIGCNAMDSDVVRRIRELKGSSHPFSVIVPSKGWIKQWLFAKNDFLKKLPGPYTLILRKKNPDFLNEVSSLDSLGIRIPRHVFSELVCEAGIPFITTSVNILGQKPVVRTEEIPEPMRKAADFIIDGGVLNNRPSKVIDLTSGKPMILRE